MKATDHVKRAAITKLMEYLLDNPQENINKIMDLLDKIVPAAYFGNQRVAIKGAIERQDNWYQLLMKVLELNPEMRDEAIKTFVIDANLMVWDKQEANRTKYKCNIPWAILLDPTSACNLKCTGCWAAEYGNALNLSYDDIDSIITQGKELGVHVYIYTGGEPLVRKKDIIRLCEAHPDCAFLCFTNGTLIDEEFCQELIRVKNFIPSISVEGNEAATDSRRGEGTFQKVSRAMDLLKKNRLPFGVSCCFTSQNASSIMTEEFYDWLIDKGALFAWIFTYMPVGADSPVDLMATAEQRAQLYDFVREMRSKKPLFTLDFWNDGEFVGGCIAGGRRYLHINANGDVEPCVFAHYSNANIHDVSLLDALRSPIFMAYYNGQPFNDNYLRPCPMLDNPGVLAEMVERTGAKNTDYMAQEPAEVLCEKCRPSAEEWAPVSYKIWNNPDDPMWGKRSAPNQGLAKSDLKKFERLGRTHQPAGVQTEEAVKDEVKA